MNFKNIDQRLQQFLEINNESEILEYKEAKNQYDLNKLGMMSLF